MPVPPPHARTARFQLLMLVTWGILMTHPPAAPAAEDPFPVSITVDADQASGPWIPFWRFFGADEPNYAYMPEGERLLGELGHLGSVPVFFRTHHLLTSGDGAHAPKFGSTSAYKEDAQGNPVYDWTINDRIFDAYLKQGVRPYVQLGFMPEALSIHPQDYLKDPSKDFPAPVKAGHAYPPKSYQRWGDLCHEWAKHCVERYGKEEVQQWYWQVWNEANASTYWGGTIDDYFKLYDYAVDGVRRALPEARVGGPETASGAGGSWMHDFLEHCARGRNHATGAIGAPLDFLSFHAKGQPTMVDGRICMGMSEHLSTIDDGFRAIAASPEYRHLPVIIGESDPDSGAAYLQPYSPYRNGTLYATYTAASFPRKLELAARHGVDLQGALTWSFTFVDKPPFAGYRQLASAGIDHPVLNVFRMYGRMSGQRLPLVSDGAVGIDEIRAGGVRGRPDVSGWASRDGDHLTVMLWHYHDLDVAGRAAAVHLVLHGSASAAVLTRRLIDDDHGNAYTAWLRMGSPAVLSAQQRTALAAAAALGDLGPAQTLPAADGRIEVAVHLPRQSVMLLRFDLQTAR